MGDEKVVAVGVLPPEMEQALKQHSQRESVLQPYRWRYSILLENARAAMVGMLSAGEYPTVIEKGPASEPTMIDEHLVKRSFGIAKAMLQEYERIWDEEMGPEVEKKLKDLPPVEVPEPPRPLDS